MRAHLSRVVALVLVVCAWLCNPSGEVQAHPQLAGDWVSPTPLGGFQVFHFQLGEHFGNGLWKGQSSQVVSNVSIVCGTYTLNMIDDRHATLVPVRSAHNMSPTVGIVDFTSGTLTVKNVTYRHRLPVILPARIVAPAP